MPQKDDIKKLIVNCERRLQKLREQKALFGIHTPPYILIEIEDTETQIQKLRMELEVVESNSTNEKLRGVYSTFVKNSTSFPTSGSIRGESQEFLQETLLKISHCINEINLRNKWQDSDNFSIRLSKSLINSVVPQNERQLLKSIKKVKTSFFHLNHISRERYTSIVWPCIKDIDNR